MKKVRGTKKSKVGAGKKVCVNAQLFDGFPDVWILLVMSDTQSFTTTHNCAQLFEG